MNTLTTCFFSKFKQILAFSTCAAFLLLLVFAITTQPARSEESLATARMLSESGQILSLEKIIESAKTIKSGDFLEIELERKSNIYVYEVELLDNNGQVWELKFNAKTGELIKIERDD